MDKTEFGHITPPTPDVGFHATKYALGVALAPGTQAVPDMVEVPREPTKAMLDAVSGMSVSGPYLGSNEARDIWDVMLTLAAQAAPDDDDRDLDLDAFHREVWGWLLKRGLVTNDEAEWDGFTTVIEEHEQEIEAAASRAAASDLTALQAENERLRAAIKHEIHHNLILFTKVRELETEQARWTNAVAVTVPGVFPQDYVVRSPCDLAPPRPDVLYVDGAVYRRETAAEASR
ncbi:hypothetical protein [Mesorhizobium sp.]|uniref:hypothetical protein n=1 Tax=Mesorhizobium sp. TaxID=1871066 RepID=UPI00257EB907|nr:hypothetical protein [Mesorhizobium sp.]